MYYTNNLVDWTGKPRDSAILGGQGQPLRAQDWPRDCGQGPSYEDQSLHTASLLPSSLQCSTLPTPHGGQSGPLNTSV